MTTPEHAGFDPDSLDSELAALLEANAELDAEQAQIDQEQRQAEALVDGVMRARGIFIEHAERDLENFDSLPKVIEMRRVLEEQLGSIFADIQVRKFHERYQQEVEEMQMLRSLIASALVIKTQAYGPSPSESTQEKRISFKREMGYEIFYANERFVDLEPFIQVYDDVMGGEPLLDMPDFDGWLDNMRSEEERIQALSQRSRECRREIESYLRLHCYTFNQPMSAFVSGMVQVRYVDQEQAKALGLTDTMVNRMLDIVDSHFPERAPEQS